MSVVKISCGLAEWAISMGVVFAALCWSVKYLLPMAISMELSKKVNDDLLVRWIQVEKEKRGKKLY
jgi:hypothetical protein